MRGLAIAALAAGVLLVTPARASDFTLHVPVHIENLHSATQFFVTCSVVTTGTTIATASTPALPLSGGGYDGTVTLAMNAGDLTAARMATAYRCELSVLVTNSHTGGTARVIVAAYGAPTTPNPGYAPMSGQSLTSVQGFVTGPLH